MWVIEHLLYQKDKENLKDNGEGKILRLLIQEHLYTRSPAWNLQIIPGISALIRLI